MTPEALALYFIFLFVVGGIALAQYIIENLLGIGGDE